MVSGESVMRFVRRFISLRALTGIVALVALAGCNVTKDYVPPQSNAPAGWHAGQATLNDQEASALLARWWHGFNDPVLDMLVARAIGRNYDIRIATQRLQQARAMRDVAVSAQYPQIAVNMLATRNQTGYDWAEAIGVYNSFTVGFDAAWEIDVFGGVRRSVEAAQADVGASVESRRDVLVSLLAELATNYAVLRAAQERLAIARANVAISEETLRLMQVRFDKGLVPDQDVAQIRAQLESVRAVVPEFMATIQWAINAIAILVGGFPGETTALLEKSGPLLGVPSTLPLTVPSEVMLRRPDVRRAERMLAAATARVGVAEAQFFPKFIIPFGVGSQAGTIQTFLSPASFIWNFGAAVGQPVFQGGRIEAQKRLADAIAESDRLAYEKAVRAAVRDVEDALVGYGSQGRRVVLLESSAQAQGIARMRSQQLYDRGLTDYFRVLYNDRSVWIAQDDIVVAKLAQVRQLIALYKALGGGWSAGELDE